MKIKLLLRVLATTVLTFLLWALFVSVWEVLLEKPTAFTVDSFRSGCAAGAVSVAAAYVLGGWASWVMACLLKLREDEENTCETCGAPAWYPKQKELVAPHGGNEASIYDEDWFADGETTHKN